MVRHSDIPSPPGHPNPGRLVILDHGVHGQTFQTFLMSLNERAARREEELGELVSAGRLAPEPLLGSETRPGHRERLWTIVEKSILS